MRDSKKKIIVFDLDETLIHATKQKLGVEADFQYQDYYVYKRPYILEFLESCSKLCHIAIWSSAEDSYVKGIVNELIGNAIELEFVWGRSECWMKIVKVEDELTGLKKKEYQFIKPLEKIRRKGFKMKNLLIIDDSLYKVTDNPENYFIIKPFEGNCEDNELKFLESYLKILEQKGDFKIVDRVGWKNLCLPD
ncbi:HAD family hydrolase [Chondrinema litorale]|uniref:HAD family hydrolase n=1 Tax=Chondrinema litorale TaxID=2994555 RepID=UPI002542EAB5|nr:HAD family hydrolase [Chondrinema litorale]UZR92680.1 HAD family hydrolase [Chondrinema litorale]